MAISTVHARYNMLADFLLPSTTRTGAGQIIRSWDYDNPVAIKNLTEGILGGGIRVVGSTEMWGEDYEPVEWAKMYIAEQTLRQFDSLNQPLPNPNHDPGDPESPEHIDSLTVTRRWRVHNIRDRVTNEILWTDDDLESIEFNIMGITPIRDPFGARGAVEYELLLKGVTND